MPAAAPAAALPSGAVREIKVTGVRKLIAERMLASLATTAQLTLNSSADARALQEFRARFKESPEGMGLRGVTINDMVLFAVSRALLEHPEMNAHFSGRCDQAVCRRAPRACRRHPSRPHGSRHPKRPRSSACAQWLPRQPGWPPRVEKAGSLPMSWREALSP